MRTSILALPLLMLTLSVAGQPTVTAINPSSAPAEGGTVVTITGSGFASGCPTACPTVGVLFGSMNSPKVVVISDTQLQVTTPAHLPGPAEVLVFVRISTARLPEPFTFTGSAEPAFETLLLPILLPPVRGANGSEFLTLLTGSTRAARQNVHIFGLRDQGNSSGQLVDNPLLVVGRLRADIERSGTPGRLIYIQSGEAETLALNLRVVDVSRSTTTYGTEIPIVRQSEFRTDSIVLNDVPLDPHFRNTLRIYSMSSSPVVALVTIGDTQHEVLIRGSRGQYDPGYGEFTNFPSAVATNTRVTIDSVTTGGVATPVDATALWAFITVTNNETQHITTVTPN